MKKEKVLVNLSVPSIGESFDIRIPAFLKVSALVPLLVESVAELSSGEYVCAGDEYLCCLERDCVLSRNYTIAENGVRNGDHLLLL